MAKMTGIIAGSYTEPITSTACIIIPFSPGGLAQVLRRADGLERVRANGSSIVRHDDPPDGGGDGRSDTHTVPSMAPQSSRHGSPGLAPGWFHGECYGR
jgi:hypothetical protein